jgi:hypothetical protein
VLNSQIGVRTKDLHFQKAPGFTDTAGPRTKLGERVQNSLRRILPFSCYKKRGLKKKKSKDYIICIIWHMEGINQWILNRAMK